MEGSFSSSDGVPTPARTVTALADHVCSLLGPTARAALHYGSRAQGRATRPDSAFDFFIIVGSYRQAYRAFAARPQTQGHGTLAFILSWILPPNAISVRMRDALGEHEAKCLVFSKRHFRRECSRRARDHFVQGRISQRVLLAWSRDADCAEEAWDAVRQARERTYQWVRVFLPPRFDVAVYCRTMLEVSLTYEIRMEGKGYAETLYAAQRDVLRGIYGPVLARLEQRGVLTRDEGFYRQVRVAGVVTRLRVRTYFRFSTLRATLRLLKHPFLYDDWLDYLVQKIDRSTGVKVVLTDRERKWPLIFLWPRAIRFLRHRQRNEVT